MSAIGRLVVTCPSLDVAKREDVFREIKISAELEHPQIANMREFYIDRKKVSQSHHEYVAEDDGRLGLFGV